MFLSFSVVLRIILQQCVKVIEDIDVMELLHSQLMDECLSTQVKQSFQSDSDPDYVGFRRNPTKHGRNSIGLYAVPVVSDDRNPTERIPTTHSRDPTEIIWIRWDPTGHN